MSMETGTVNSKGDNTIEMDTKIETIFLDYIRKNELPVQVYSEEIGIVNDYAKPTHIMAFDPLDGSTNYRVGENLFPYGILIAVYEGLKPKIKNVVAAGSIEITNDMGFIYSEGMTYDLDGNRNTLKDDWKIEPKTPLYVDLYRKSYYETYENLAGMLYLRNSGSTIGNLSFVLANAASGLGHPNIKAEEVGAVYGLIKGSGGSVVNQAGVDIGETDFHFEGSYNLLAGHQKITDYIVQTLT